MKIYFQIQGGKKLRVYKIDSANVNNEKRKQNTLAVLSSDDEIPDDLMRLLSDEDKMRLIDTFGLLQNQVEYERIRDAVLKIPVVLERASELLSSGRLTLSDEQKKNLREKTTMFLKNLR